MARIEIEGVSKEYISNNESITAVSDLDLTIDDGDFLVLVGPSGCGKSTTLRMIAGLESITEGTISLGGTVVNDKEPKERDIAMVFQNYALYPHKTVRQNMGFGLRYSSNLSKAEIKNRVEETADMMGISELLDEKPSQLSGGQQQRVALGRAIVREPKAFLFDEPLSNLDAKLRTHMRTEITRLQRELDVTSVYVTHDQAEAMTMGDQIAVMNSGELQQVGPPNQVYAHPVNQFVAGFIGSPRMNFINAILNSQGPVQTLVDAETTGDVLHYEIADSIAENAGLSEGDEVTVGVRPEELDIMADIDESHPQRVQTTVDVVEPMGSDNFVTIDVGNDSWVARASPSFDPEPGSILPATFDPHSLHLFAPDGRTLKSQGTTDGSFHEEDGGVSLQTA